MIKILIHHGNLPKELIVPHLKNGYTVVQYNIRILLGAPWSKLQFEKLLSEASKPLDTNSLYLEYKPDVPLSMNVQESFSFFSQSKLYERKWYRQIVIYLDKPNNIEENKNAE